MLRNCGRGPRPIRLCVEKIKNFDEIWQRRTCRKKWGKILICPFSPNLNPLEYGTFPTCLKIAGEALGLLGCVLKRLNILMKLIGPFSPNLKPLEFWTCPTCLKIAGEALGLLGCVLKRLKILKKSNTAGPVFQNGAKF